MLEWSAADSCRWSGKCIQGTLETLFFKDARVQSEGRCFCVELQFLWTFFFVFYNAKTISAWICNKNALSHATGQSSCLYELFMNIFYLRVGLLIIFLGKWPGCCVRAVCIRRLRYSKVIFMDSAKGDSFTHTCPHFFLLQYTYKWMFCFFLKTGSLLHFTSMDWTVFNVSKPSAWTSSGLRRLSPFILNETGKEKTARTFYVSGKIADCSFSWTAEDAMMKYSLSAKLSPPTSLLLIQFYLYYSGVVKCTSGSMVAFLWIVHLINSVNL